MTLTPPNAFEEHVLDRSKIGTACFVLITAVLLPLISSDRIWSSSVDLAHHYALVERLLEPGGVGSTPDLTLGEMQFYPRVGHLIATVVASVLGSSIAGMALTGTASLTVIWIAVAYLLSAVGRPIGMRVLFASAMTVGVGGTVLKLQIFGNEIVGNYFFSQLIAQAVLLIAVAAALWLERQSFPRWLRYGFLAASILVIESIHLLPAIEGLGVLGFLLLSDVVDSWDARATNGAVARSIVRSVLLLAATTAAVIAHPTFAVMRTISENNGALPLTLFRSLTGLFALALVVFGLSIALMLRSRNVTAETRQSALPLRYIGALGASCSVLFALQWLAGHFGQGSEYASKKYVFALTSIFLIEAPLFLIATPSALKIAANAHQGKAYRFVDSIALIAFIVAAFLAATPRHADLSVAKMRGIERETKAIQTFRLEHGITGRAFAIHLPAASPVLDYMFSIATLKAPRDDATYDVLLGRTPRGLAQDVVIVTGRDDPTYDVHQCRFPTATTSLVAVDARCFVTAKHLNSTCRDYFDLTSASPIDPSLLSGFSSQEPAGSWTDAKSASFKCEMPVAATFRPRFVDVTASAFVPSGHKQRLTLSLGDSDVHQSVVFTRPAEARVITLPISSSTDHWLSLRFSLPDAISPAQAGVSADARLLGVQISAIRLR
ncbi:hypothetical protein LJR230_000910 [Trinickia sp. LjRoot230]|uniref:hypothetical protein n=1 Tax=Trinickia sp. LjRoot230 TaxID=3342288 RepID=UPI003ECD1147